MEKTITQGCERPTFFLRPAARYALAKAAPAAFFSLLSLVAALQLSHLFIFLALAAAARAAWVYMLLRSRLYRISPQFISERKGVLVRRTSRMELARLADIGVRRGRLERILGVVRVRFYAWREEKIQSLTLDGVPCTREQALEITERVRAFRLEQGWEE